MIPGRTCLEISDRSTWTGGQLQHVVDSLLSAQQTWLGELEAVAALLAANRACQGHRERPSQSTMVPVIMQLSRGLELLIRSRQRSAGARRQTCLQNNKAAAGTAAYSVSPTHGSKLTVNGRDVEFDRVLADMQLPRDLLV